MNEQRHVLIFPVSLWRGMAGTRRVKLLVDELATKGGYAFSNLIISDPNEYSGHTEAGTEQAIPFCRIGYRYHNPLKWLNFWYSGLRFIYRMQKGSRYNFVYCYQETDIVTLPLLLVARWLGYKIIVDVVEDNTFLKNPHKNWLARIRVRSGIWLLNSLPVYADAAIAISTYLLQKIKGITNGRIPVVLVPISVNLQVFDQRPTAPILRFDNRPFRIFYGGSFGAKDGINYLLQAIKLCLPVYPAIRLVLTGTGSTADMSDFHTWVNTLQLERTIDYRGYLSDDAYIRTLQSCDVFCMTRTNSSFANAGFPFKLGEMLATGKPVIATKVGDIEKYLVDFESALLIEPNKPDQIANRLIWLINNYPQAMTMGSRGRQVAEQHFSASCAASQLNNVFDELILTA